MTHPILAAVSDIRAILKGVAGANPTFMSTSEKAVALRELVAAEAQLVELRLRVLADAGDLADATGAKDAAGWLAHQTRTRFADARADLALAGVLDRERPVLAAGMREGAVTLAQAHVIRRALDALPAAVDADTVDRAEAHLVACAGEFGPKELGRIGRRVLDVVAPEIAEAAEAARLADLETAAAERTRMTMRRQGDGTTRISALVPDAVATRLATYLEAFANPRAHAPDNDPRASRRRGRAGDPFTRLPYPRRMGEAFARFLETADPTRLPIHGGDATTVIVTIPLASLRAELATADLIGAGLVPGDDLTGDRITASEARRLACTAKILPAVLDGTSLPRRPRTREAALHPGPTQGAADPRPHVSHRRLRRPRHLVRRPPPRPLAHRRTHRHRRRRSCSAHTTTTAPTTPPTAPNDSPTATSGSTDGRRPTPEACTTITGAIHESD